MLRNASAIHGCAIQASDGKIGTVSDILFDQGNWLIRWLVVDTGDWLPGRKVLLPASVLGHIDLQKQEFAVRLTMEQVKDSPEVDTDKPVSRQMESHVYSHYGWHPYWDTNFTLGTDFTLGAYSGIGGGLTTTPLQEKAHKEELDHSLRRDGNPHLRSIKAVTGYHIHASDGDIGHVEDFLVQEDDWSIHYLLVDTMNWWPGKKVLISPRSVNGVDWYSKLVSLSVDRQQVKGSPAYKSSTLVDRTFERNFHNYYSDGRHHENSRL
jgi:hypothetical protein